MSFTEAQKVDIRRFMGYPAYGAGPSGFNGFRFFEAYGFMEFKLGQDEYGNDNLTPEEQTVVLTIYLPNLYTLETAIVGASANLDTDRAAVWYHNRDEVADRERLYASWRLKLCQFLGVPPGKGLNRHDGSLLV